MLDGPGISSGLDQVMELDWFNGFGLVLVYLFGLY